MINFIIGLVIILVGLFGVLAFVIWMDDNDSSGGDYFGY